MLKILFLCTGNSCRSQMAEGWARSLKSADVEAYSAGIETHGLNPLAVRAMAEAGVDITDQQSQHVDTLKHIHFDYVVTVCDKAASSCPTFFGATLVHRPFDDPPRLAREAQDEEEAMLPYRRVRDEIRAFVELLPLSLKSESTTLIDHVREQYSAVATRGLSSRDDGVRAVAEAFGYSAAELASLPAEANMGLSCGNPTATANLRPGEVVVDLGCGGGLDVLLAARQVGPHGKAIGIDMSQQMIDLAQRNARRGVDGQSVENVEFHLSTIDRLPLPDASVDCVISNCVINLAPDKSAVLRDVHRVLRPGGRLALSDIALKEALPPEMQDNLAAYVGCIAGAMLMDDYRQLLLQSGFAAVEVVDAGADLNAYSKAEDAACCVPAPADVASEPAGGLAVLETSRCCGGDSGANSSIAGGHHAAQSGLHERLADLLRRYDVNQFAASVRVFALKRAE